MKIALIGNGKKFDCSKELATYDLIVAIDGGANHCKDMNITPNYIIGDQDSIEPATKEKFSDVNLIEESGQSNTDLDKALQFIEQKIDDDYEIDLFCVTSSDRIDHSFAALMSLMLVPQINSIITEYQKIMHTANIIELTEPVGTNISILPFGKTAYLKLTNFKWSGDNITLDSKNSGISNEIAKSPATIKVIEGSVIVYITLDQL
ncbi:MAG: thiamine diphosphokinase [bacterium]|nr:thiamine diphosphokinase [bacterium]